MIKPYIILAALLLWIGSCFGTYEYGKSVKQDEWNLEKMHDAAALAVHDAKLAEDKKVYDAQLKLANDGLTKVQAQITTLLAIPHSHVVCHAVPNNSSTVSGVSRASGTKPSGAGALSQGSDFDPTERLYNEVADDADRQIEACRDLQNRIPRRS